MSGQSFDTLFTNPFRPGAGHYPPYLAGRESEQKEFLKLLDQEQILNNLILTGLRGVGKTVLLEKFKPLAQGNGWLWTGTDLSESVSVSEENLAIRIIIDLSIATSNWSVPVDQIHPTGFTGKPETVFQPLDYDFLLSLYHKTPGLVLDKLKGVLETVWELIKVKNFRGVIFAYDEAQNIGDNAERGQYPLGVLLDTFQSLQRKGIPFMLFLVGLPTLFPKLVEARTYSERMFRVVTLDRLTKAETRDAILKPIDVTYCPIRFDLPSVELIVSESGGYPYFVQFICREVFDVWVADQKTSATSIVPIEPIKRKLDTDFFAGRWSKTTGRQRDLLQLIAYLDNSDKEFTALEIIEASENNSTIKTISSSQCNQLLASLTRNGLVYKNRHGRYSFAVPLLGQFIRRHLEHTNQPGI